MERHLKGPSPPQALLVPVQNALSGQAKPSVVAMLRNDAETVLPSQSFRSDPEIRLQIPEKRPRVASNSPHLKSFPKHRHVVTSMTPSRGPLEAESHFTPQASPIPGSRFIHPGHQQPSTGPHRLYNGHIITQHPSRSRNYPHLGLPSHGRPRSPFAYPARLRRPGYRPSSPAWSDMVHSARDTNVGPRSQSPLSIQSLSRPQSPWAQRSNHSDPALIHYPPFLARGNHLPRHQSPTSSRTSTPRPSPSLAGITNSSRVASLRRARSTFHDQAVTRPGTPLFYDYSEGFEDSGSHRIQSRGEIFEQNRLPRASPDIVPAPNGEAQSQLFPATPSGYTNLSRDENCRISHAKASDQPKVHPHQSHMLRRFKGDEGAVDSEPVTQSLQNRTLPSSRRPHRSHAGDQSEQIASEEKPQQLLDVSPECIIGNAEFEKPVQQKELWFTQYESTSSLTGSMQTAESTANTNLETSQNNSSASILPNPGRVSTTGTDNAEDVGSLHTVIAKASTPGDEITSDLSRIISPTPERSTLSEASRYRFSRILGIDEPMSKADQKAQLPPGPIQKSHLSQTSVPGLHGESLVPDDQSSDLARSTDDSDSDEALKLSASLMNIFGRYSKMSETKGQAVAASHTTGYTSKTSTRPSEKNPEIVETSTLSRPNGHGSNDQLQPKCLSRTILPNKNRFAHIIEPSLIDEFGAVSRSLPLADKERIVVPIVPPITKSRRSLPFAFSSLKANVNDDTTISSDLEATLESVDNLMVIDRMQDAAERLPTLIEGQGTDRESTASSQSSRPWNRDSNYPWEADSLKLDVALPQEKGRTSSPNGMIPKFKLRIHRASTSSAGTGLQTRSRSSSDITTSLRRGHSKFIRRKPIFKTIAKSGQAVGPSQENSSHGIGNETLRSRFVESFDPPARADVKTASPIINLVPASPGHEVRSFFSDDSSHTRHKGGLRQRLSEFKTRRSRSNSTDDAGGHDRNMLSTTSFGRSGRASRQSQTTGLDSNASKIRRPRSRMLHKVRFWWQQREARPRTWKWSLRKKRSSDKNKA